MSKPLSLSAQRRHIRSGGCDVYERGCLYCKAGAEGDETGTVENGEVLEFGGLSPVENGDIEQEVKCLRCGRKWIDVFRLAEIREIV